MEPKASYILGKSSESYLPLPPYSLKGQKKIRKRGQLVDWVGNFLRCLQAVKSAGWENTVTSRTGWQKAVGENSMLLFICVARTQNPCP